MSFLEPIAPGNFYAQQCRCGWAQWTSVRGWEREGFPLGSTVCPRCQAPVVHAYLAQTWRAVHFQKIKGNGYLWHTCDRNVWCPRCGGSENILRTPHGIDTTSYKCPHCGLIFGVTVELEVESFVASDLVDKGEEEDRADAEQ